VTVAKKNNPFILPERTIPENLDDDYDHKEFKQWISDLPIGDIGKVARALHHEIKRHNCLDLSPVERFEALQLMMPALDFVREGLWSRYANKPIPFSRENSLIARLHLELLVNVVIAYKTVMSQFHDDSFTGHLLHKHTRVESVRCTLYFLGEILLHEHSIYRASPKFVWREIHGIYHYAVVNELLSDGVEDAGDYMAGQMGIEDIYKRTLLLGLTDPSGLLRGEIKRVSMAVIDWLPEVSLVPVGHELASVSMFIVDSTKDAPPHVADAEDLKQIKIGWVLLTDKLEQSLKRKIAETRGASETKLRPMELVTTTLYSKLFRKWAADAVLREERAKGSGVIEVVSGLDSLHWLFGGWKLPQGVGDSSGITVESDPSEVEVAQFDVPVHAVERDEFILDADPGLIAAMTPESGSAAEQVGIEPPTHEDIEVDFYDALMDDVSRGYECACINESKRGYYLTWAGEGEYKAHVGDLIGVNSRDNLDFDSSWGFGVIRWMRIQAGGIMGFGVELFEGEIESVRLESRHVKEPATEEIVGFQQKIDGKIDTIITKPFFFDVGDKLMLTTVDGRIPIVPGQTVECTDAFIRFKVHLDSGAVEDTKQGSMIRSEAEDIFNSIWDEL